jgi:hypothetical protein
VRRAEELARRMKVKSQQESKRIDQPRVRIISEEIDKMQEDMQKAFVGGNDADGQAKKASVKLIRSQRETRLVFVFKGGLEETEDKLQKVYKSIIS